MRICRAHSASFIIYGFVFQVINVKTLCSKDYTDNLRDSIKEFIPANLYNSCKFNYRFAFVTLYSFRKNQKQEKFFNKLLLWLQKPFMCFVYSELHSTSKARRIQ